MALPTKNTGLSPAVADLGLGGLLQQQVTGETEEERKKRLQQMQENQMMGPAGSPATLSLLGGSRSAYGG